jgi:hypothetical protein
VLEDEVLRFMTFLLGKCLYLVGPIGCRGAIFLVISRTSRKEAMSIEHGIERLVREYTDGF